MYYTFKDCNILINNRPVAISRATLTSTATLEPNFVAGEGVTNTYNPVSNLEGALSLNYFLTGHDFLRSWFGKENVLINGNVAGLTFQSGHLKSYSLRIAPFQPVEANVDIIFYDIVKGQLQKTVPITKTMTFLNGSDVSVSSNNYGAFGVDSLSGIFEISYNLNQEILPSFRQISDENLIDILPDRFCFNKSEVSLDITYSSASGGLTFLGEVGNLELSFLNNAQITTDSIRVSGFIYRKESSFEIDNIVKQTIGIKQPSIVSSPSINTMTPMTGYWGDRLLLSGENLFFTQNMFINFVPTSFEIIDDYSLYFIIPETYSGRVKLSTIGGSVLSTGIITITQQDRNLFGSYLGESPLLVGDLPNTEPTQSNPDAP